jgi:membrane protein
MQNPIVSSNIKLTPAPISFIKRCYRVLRDTLFGFIEDDCYTKASALTYYSLLSIVPVLAVLFGIAKGFGFEKALEREINERFYEQREIVDRLIEFAYSWLKSAQGGVIAGIGTIVLLWSVFGLLCSIENALNSIWKTRFSRPYARKISDYLATMIICPIFLVTLSSLNVFIHTHFTKSSDPSNVFIEAVSPFVVNLLKLSPLFLSWGLFTFMYMFMPYTKVYARSAIIAGILFGSVFQAWQWIYIKFQIGVSSYGAIYGSFAALPLFLVWVQISWMILLAGAELAFETENDIFVPARDMVNLSSKAAALLITYRCIDAFVKGEPPITDRILAHELGMSLNHVHMLIEVLQNERILSATSFQNKTNGYQPARAINSISMQLVCHAIENGRALLAAVKDSSHLDKINLYLEETEKILDAEDNNPELYTYAS